MKHLKCTAPQVHVCLCVLVYVCARVSVCVCVCGHLVTKAHHKGAVNLFSAFSHPGPSFLKDPPRSSGQLCSARGPSEVNCPSLVRDGHEFCYFACFYCWGSYWRKPLVNTGRTCKLHTERPRR